MFDELERANKTYATSFVSPHEGYAVLLEELDELWDEIKKERPDNNRMREEAIQVGAMAIKFIASIEQWTSTEVHINKCRQCLYVVMTAAKLAELGSDPCETCDGNLSNWKGKEDERIHENPRACGRIASEKKGRLWKQFRSHPT